ncbi:hypothetical protein ACFYVL_12580 [Streptomyces sp. NPDC004111]|uniref:hypothetical protein n=1 Tax=Streptomyces sp. NPDC004111 TaxID=3364690 RepID=UPI0036BD5AED
MDTVAALRPLLTATAAGGLLAALWFVPSANATGETPEQARKAQQAAASAPNGPTARTAGTGPAAGTAGASAQSDAHLALADTGSVDTTPYLIGGTAFLGIGAGFVTYSVRRRGASGDGAGGALA